MMKKVKLYVNSTKNNAWVVAEEVRKELIAAGYEVTDENPDIVIGFGGDGTFIKCISYNNYDTETSYIGINCGNLGFMQSFDIISAKMFVENIPNYIEEHLRYVKLTVNTAGKERTFYAVNEFNVLNAEDKTFRANVNIGYEFLETFVGTGLIFATPTGSTARNISSVGSIMFPTIEAIQMTPIEAIVNSKIHCMPKSICIPSGMDILLTPANDSSIKIIADGINVFEGNYNSITISYSDRYMITLTDRKNSFVKKIREKLI